jgi:di/tripeptidase
MKIWPKKFKRLWKIPQPTSKKSRLMNKLQKKAQKSKLNVVQENTTEKLLTTQRKLAYPVSFRLDANN